MVFQDTVCIMINSLENAGLICVLATPKPQLRALALLALLLMKMDKTL